MSELKDDAEDPADGGLLEAWERWWSAVDGTPGEIVWDADAADLAADLEIFGASFDRQLPVVDLGTTIRAAEVGGVALGPGARLFLLYGSANHDETRCVDPEGIRARPEPDLPRLHASGNELESEMTAMRSPTVPIASWLFEIFGYPGDPSPDRWDSALATATYQHYLQRWVRAEDRGFAGVFFSEHHATPINMSPSPNLLVAAAAARTTTLGLGVMANVVPLHDPRRLAEEAAMLDTLSAGRLHLGLGPGVGGREAQLYGIPPDQLHACYRRGVSLISRALATGRFPVPNTSEDAGVDADLALVPRPMRPGGPPIWITAMSPESADWAGRQGYRLATAWFPTPQIALLFDTWRAAAAAAGYATSSERIALRRRVFVAPTDSEAHDILQAAPDTFIDVTLAQAGVHRDRAAEVFGHADDIVVGSPATVTEILATHARITGAGNLLMWTDFRGFDADQLDRCHHLLGRVARNLTGGSWTPAIADTAAHTSGGSSVLHQHKQEQS